MLNILKHDLFPIPLSLANYGFEMNSTVNAVLISMLMVGHRPSSEELIESLVSVKHLATTLMCSYKMYHVTVDITQQELIRNLRHWGGFNQGSDPVKVSGQEEANSQTLRWTTCATSRGAEPIH